VYCVANTVDFLSTSTGDKIDFDLVDSRVDCESTERSVKWKSILSPMCTRP